MKTKLILIFLVSISVLTALYIFLPVKTEYKSKTCAVCGFRSANTKKSFVLFNVSIPFYYIGSSSYNRKKVFDIHLGYEHAHIWCYQDNGIEYHSYFGARESGHGRCGLNGYPDDYIYSTLFWALNEIGREEFKDLNMEKKKKLYEEMLKAKDVEEIMQMSENYLRK